MHIALCNEVIRDMPIERQAAYAAALGYDGLEIAPFTLDGENPHQLSAEVVANVRRCTESEGLSVSGLHWLLVAPQGLSITSEDPAIRAKTDDVGLAMVDMCAALGGSYLIHGSPAQRLLTGGEEGEGRSRALDYFAKVSERAEEAGVTYCLEALSPEQTNFVTNISEAIAIVDEIGSPAFKTMLDCSAAALSEKRDIPDLLGAHLADGMIRHVHFNDPNRRSPGQGDLRFGPIVRKLAEMSYDGWIGVEPFVYEPTGPASAARAIGYIRALEEELQ